MKRFFPRLETVTLILWLGVAGSVWAFMSLGGEMAEGETLAFDRRILVALRNPADLTDPVGPRWLEESLRDVTALGGFTVLWLIVAVSALAFLFHGKRRQAGLLVTVAVLAQLSANLLKGVYGRPRPDFLPHDMFVYAGSFPSGHSTVAAAAWLTLATMIASLEPKAHTKALAYAAAIFVILTVGFSRIYLGVHWPSDVLAGWTLGAGWALAGWIALRMTAPARNGV
jgi:undecaprenyl-diphosphatase